MAEWKERSDWFLKGFITGTKQMRLDLARMIEFFNGDSSGQVLTHFCQQGQAGKGPCCKSDEDAACKAMSLLIPFFSRGFPTPLLYRMKHYGPGSSFMKVGCCWFGILPQILRMIENMSGTQDTELSTMVDTFLMDGRTASADADFQTLVAEALDGDTSYATQNSIRKKLVVNEISRDGFDQSVMIIDSLLLPMEVGVNSLLGHTKLLHGLSYMGNHHPEAAQLMSSAREKFMNLVQGRFSARLVQGYLHTLQDGLEEAIRMGLHPLQEQLNLIFALAVTCMSDCHRRFHRDYATYPFALFNLLDVTDTAAFVSAWKKVEVRHRKCPSCVDAEFTGVLVQHFARLSKKTSGQQEAAKAEIRALLEDIASWCPMTSDTVELKNGGTQWCVSRRGRSAVKSPDVAAELTLLQAAIKQNQWVQESIGVETLPAKAVSSSILQMAGATSSNQKAPDSWPAWFGKRGCAVVGPEVFEVRGLYIALMIGCGLDVAVCEIWI